MLARLMVFLGTDVQKAHDMVAQAEKDSEQASVTQMPDGQAALALAEPFDRAWRRVGVATDSASFAVDDRARSAGDYFIRYLDSDSGQKIEQHNFIGRLFGSNNTHQRTILVW